MEARSQKRENSEQAGQQRRASGSDSACPDLMVAPNGGGQQQRFVPGVTLSSTGWAFVAASGASSVTAVAAGVVLLRGLSTLGGGTPVAPPVEMAISRVVPVAGSLTPPISVATPDTRMASSVLVPIPAVGPLLASPTVGLQIPIPAVGGAFAAATARAEVIDGRTLLAGAFAAGSTDTAPTAGTAITLPAARTTDDVASTLALAAAAGAADGTASEPTSPPATVAPAVFAATTEVGGPGLPPLAARGEIAKNPAAFRLLTASTTPTRLPSKSLGSGAAAPVAPVGIRPRATLSSSAVPVAPAAVSPADLPDIAVTGLVLGDSSTGGVAVIQERGSSHRRFVNVGDSIGMGDRFVVASVDAHGVVLRDTQARSKQNRTFRLGIQSATLREHLATQEAEEAAGTTVATISPAKPRVSTASVFAAATTRPAAAYSTPAPPAPAPAQPVVTAAAVAAPTAPQTPAPEIVTPPAKPAEEVAKPAAKAEEPHFLLTTGKSTAASESDIATVESPRPELTWRLLAPASQVSSGTAPEVIDFRVLLYELDETEQKAGGEGKLVSASQPLSENHWVAGGKENAPLNAGSLYRWQVYARMSDGTLAVSPMVQFRVAAAQP